MTSLDRLAHAADNDYAALEEEYRRLTGGELVRDPCGSARLEVPLTLTASVVVPAWNARSTLEQCLIALEQSSFNRRYPERFEVVVVDDGSTDGTWELLRGLRLGVRLTAARQAHGHSRAQAQNTAIALARGEVVISCDSDMILAPFAVEELVRRHELLDRVMLIGFRGDVAPDDARLRPHALRAYLPELLPPFERDVRLSYPGGGWPESMCRETDHLKRLGGDRQIEMGDGSRWNLPAIVYGALFSLRRSDWLAMDGYDERFHGWGCEDTLVGVRARALGAAILPVYSAAGWHVAHGDRSPAKAREFASNRRVFQTILRAPFVPDHGRWLTDAERRVVDRLEREPDPEADLLDLGRATAALDAAFADPDRRGKYLHSLGRYEEAASAFAEIGGGDEREAWAWFDRGKALRAAGRHQEAVDLLRAAAGRLPASPWPPIELAFAFAGLARFEEARASLDRARRLDQANATVRFTLGRPRARHLERAAFYAQQGDYALALRDYEAALIHDPRHSGAVQGRGTSLVALGRATPTAPLWPAVQVPTSGRTAAPERPAAPPALSLPIASRIIERAGQIPGWLEPDEAELLVALALRAAATCDPSNPPVLVEIGRHCGRATLLMALALSGLGRDDARVIAIDGPDLGPAPDGRAPRDVLRTALATHGVVNLVTLAPEEEAAPWRLRSRLVLVDGRHDAEGVRADVARYAPSLAPGGFLVFHDYADYYPDVKRCVDDLLAGASYEEVARGGSLVALVQRGTVPDR